MGVWEEEEGGLKGGGEGGGGKEVWGWWGEVVVGRVDNEEGVDCGGVWGDVEGEVVGMGKKVKEVRGVGNEGGGVEGEGLEEVGWELQ
uniref:hypothetical protein n=1 Tax=Kocuria rhizophila TaxID=72000 RepID=UPI001C92D237